MKLKKLFMLAAAGLVFVACEKEKIVEVPVGGGTIDITWEGHDLGERQTFVKDDILNEKGECKDPLVIGIDVSEGVKSFVVEIISTIPGLDEDSLEELNLAAKFDLANPATPELATALEGLGFETGDKVKGQTELTMEITKFIPLIFALADGSGMDGKADFKVTITDNKDKKGTATVKLDIYRKEPVSVVKSGKVELTVNLDVNQLTDITKPTACKVDILNAEEESVYSATAIPGAKAVITLPEGTYTLKAEAGENKKASLTENYYYAGNTEFTVTADETGIVAYDCPIRTVVINATFDDWYTSNTSSTTQVYVYPYNDSEKDKVSLRLDKPTAKAYIHLGEEQTSIQWKFSASQKIPKPEPETGFTYKAMAFEDEFVGIKGGMRLTADILYGNMLKTVDAWSKFANVSAFIMNGGDTPAVRFAYRVKGAGTWSYAAGVLGATYTYTAKIPALTPDTEYELALEVNSELVSGQTAEFTTEKAAQMPNSGFEDWRERDGGIGGTKMVKFPDDGVTKFWDSANGGVGLSLTKDSDDKRSGSAGSKSAYMKSDVYFGTFAAGNLYTGQFKAIDFGSMSAEVSFGQPFTSRPSALKGWYKADPGLITHANAAVPDLPNGAKDEYQIYVLLTNWAEPRIVNPKKAATLIDFSADYVVGVGQITDIDGITGSEKVEQWTEFNIPIQYKSNEKPTYIVVVACASKYGDFFVGSTDSVLQVDDFELVYSENVTFAN